MPAAHRLRSPAQAADPDLSAAAHPPLHLVLVPQADLAPLPVRRQAFGARLKSARERRGVSVSEIAQSTKVSASLLTALECGDASRWPKGIFRRAFFRDYVSAIGLSPEPLVVEFLQLHPDGEDHPPAPVPAVQPSPAAPRLALDLSYASPRWALAQRGRRAAPEVVAVLMTTAVLAWSVDGGAGTWAVMSGLVYARGAVAAVRGAVATWRRREDSGDAPAAVSQRLEAAGELIESPS